MPYPVYAYSSVHLITHFLLVTENPMAIIFLVVGFYSKQKKKPKMHLNRKVCIIWSTFVLCMVSSTLKSHNLMSSVDTNVSRLFGKLRFDSYDFCILKKYNMYKYNSTCFVNLDPVFGGHVVSFRHYAYSRNVLYFKSP